MRAVERAAGGGVARTVVLEDAAIALLDLDRGMLRQEPLHPAVERDLGGRECVVLAAGQRALQAVHGFGALRRHRDCELGGFMLDGVEPVRIGAGVLQQPVARAERALERVDAALMLGVDRQHQAIEETAPLRCGSGEKLIHRRRQPHHPQMVGEGRRRADRLAVDAAQAGAARGVRRGRLDTGAERGEAEHAFHFR